MIRAYLSYWHKDANGKTIKYRRYRSDSFVGNILKFIAKILGNVTTSSISDTTVIANFIAGHEIKRLDGTNFPTIKIWTINPTSFSAGDDAGGIVVGSGTTPVTLNDFRLENKIPHGTSAGRLQYGAVFISNMVMTNPNVWHLFISRLFTNATTADITINEVGIISGLLRTAGTTLTTPLVLIARDVLEEPITLAPNESTLIQYRVNFRKT
jgi:hypothetical protein